MENESSLTLTFASFIAFSKSERVISRRDGGLQLSSLENEAKSSKRRSTLIEGDEGAEGDKRGKNEDAEDADDDDEEKDDEDNEDDEEGER